MSSIFDEQELTFSDLADSFFIRVDWVKDGIPSTLTFIQRAEFGDWENIPAGRIVGTIIREISSRYSCYKSGQPIRKNVYSPCVRKDDYHSMIKIWVTEGDHVICSTIYITSDTRYKSETILNLFNQDYEQYI